MKKVALIGIVILLGGAASLVMYFTNPENSGDKYSLQELGKKYPTVIDLNCGVQSGELEYDKLPARAKQVLENFDKKNSILNIDCESNEKKPNIMDQAIG